MNTPARESICPLDEPTTQPAGVINTLFNTRPLVFHAQGHHDFKPNWPLVREWFADQPQQHLGPRPRISVITCNNGHGAMGLLESSCAQLGIDPVVAGRGISPWQNARDKPLAICNALEHVNTPFTLYIDSRDAILIGDPEILVDHMLRDFAQSSLVFGADRLNWPTVKKFKQFEDNLARATDNPDAARSDFKYLNGGTWIAKTQFAKRFFENACHVAPHPDAPTSEQGILKAMLPQWPNDVALDYTCAMMQNVGFVNEPIFSFE